MAVEPKPKPKRKRKSRAIPNQKRKFVPTDEQRQAVMALVSIGTIHTTIARLLRFSQDTLVRHFKEELQNGREMVHARIGTGIAAMALSGDKTMMIFYAKAQMGWRDRQSIGFENAVGQPIDPPAANFYTVNITG